ncbi:hypothetical protein BOW53_11565 [Solemya pervernicosa gill symbiont]|uniref:NolW-like domain-containing protein n=2 Tax=Gammaproteobacteria incertae sedis TaxID=118884 RepID=A0A1T2L2Z4_9GAMM|nr:secretin N-terminal domain-containing protein [Solemya pervernicosa gill symbiont]OOZ39444.1 hypothetical protein BOW53_11565 [Solemya pervernicosa gill symbiont]
MKRFLLLLLLFPLMLSAASTQIEVIPLKYQSAENLLPQLKKFIDSPEQISGMGYQLILRATPERLNELKEVIKKLDLIPQQFVIIVRQGARQRMANSGDQKSIQFNSRDGRVTGNAQIRSYNTRNRSNTPTMQQLRLLEGHWGHILVGRSIPVGEQRVDQTPWGTSVQKRIRYQDVMTGFEVMARRSGSEGVTLTIAPQRQSMGSGGVIRKQELESHMSGRLGEWMEIGANLDEIERARGGTLYSTAARGWSQQRIEILVEAVR